MKTPRLECPNAEYVSGMRIRCKKLNGPCVHVHFKSCKGWWVLSEHARRCPVREEDNK